MNVARGVDVGDICELLTVPVEAPYSDMKRACSPLALTFPPLPKMSSFSKITDEVTFTTSNGGSFCTATEVTAMVSSSAALLPQDEVETMDELKDMNS